MKTAALVNTLSSETVNQTVNLSERLTVPENNQNNKDLCKSIIWLTVQETVNLLGISKVAFHKNRKADKYTTKIIKKRGGEQFAVLLSSLPESAQTAYWKQQIPESEVTLPADIEINAEIYSQTPDYNRSKADKYLAVLKASEGLAGRELKAFITAWNQKHPEMKTSYPRILDARKKYEAEGVSALTAKYGHRAGETVTSDEDYQVFKSEYLSENRPSAQSCWTLTLGMARRLRGISADGFPSVHAFMRRLEKEMPASSIYLARYGHSAWKRRYQNYVERDYSLVRAGESWVSDHAQIDVAVRYEKSAKPVFPWVCAWIDFKTEMWLGWVLYCGNPNSDRIFQAFYLAADAYGLPQDIIIDNGKDYRSKDFAGGRRKIKIEVDEPKTTAMVSMLDITPHFALPYNAQTKPIERNFLKIKENLSRHCVGFRGGNVVERPEKLLDEIKADKILNFEEFKEVFDFYIREVLVKMPAHGKKHNGLSPSRLFDQGFTEKREVSKDALKLFCTRTAQPSSITRNGVRDSEFQVTYWAEWMSAQKGRFVYLRRDIEDYAEAWVFDAHTDEYIGKARAAIFDAPALAKTKVGKEKLASALAAKKADAKITKQYLQNLTPLSAEEYVYAMAAGADALAEKVDPSTGEVTVSRLTNTRMDMVIRQDRAMSEVGKYDVGSLIPKDTGKKKKQLKLFETD
jgi:transposase InsO family protein